MTPPASRTTTRAAVVTFVRAYMQFLDVLQGILATRGWTPTKLAHVIGAGPKAVDALLTRERIFVSERALLPFLTVLPESASVDAVVDTAAGLPDRYIGLAQCSVDAIEHMFDLCDAADTLRGDATLETFAQAFGVHAPIVAGACVQRVDCVQRLEDPAVAADIQAVLRNPDQLQRSCADAHAKRFEHLEQDRRALCTLVDQLRPLYPSVDAIGSALGVTERQLRSAMTMEAAERKRRTLIERARSLVANRSTTPVKRTARAPARLEHLQPAPGHPAPAQQSAHTIDNAARALSTYAGALSADGIAFVLSLGTAKPLTGTPDPAFLTQGSAILATARAYLNLCSQLTEPARSEHRRAIARELDELDFALQRAQDRQPTTLDAILQRQRDASIRRKGNV